MLNTKCFILLIIWITGSNNTELMLSRSRSVCFYNTETQNFRCDSWPLLLEDEYRVDIHISKGYIFYITWSGISEVMRIQYHSEKKKEEVVKTDESKAVDSISVDWHNDKIYLNYGSFLSRADLLGHDSRTILRAADVAKTIATMNYELIFHHVLVDPYTESLFILAFFMDGSYVKSSFIARTNLNGENLAISPNLVFPYLIRFAIEIHREELYIVGVNNFKQFRTYNYEGKQIGLYSFGFDVAGEFHVFEDSIYVVHLNYSEEVYRQPMNPNERGDVFRPEIGSFYTLKVMDVRAQRQRANGTYLCERNDCSDLCRVRESSGDECYCYSGREVGSDHKTCEYCGQSNMTTSLSVPLIVNGTLSKRGQFPWHAVIFHLSETGSWEAKCGGTLLSPRAVLTASHCVMVPCVGCTKAVSEPMAKEKIKVVLGKTTREWGKREDNEIRLNVLELRPHLDYKTSSSNYGNDIAIIVLDDEVNYNGFVMPACVDYNCLHCNKTFKSPGFVAGMGRTKECVGPRDVCGPPSSDLQHTTLRVISFSDCYDRAQNRTRSTHIDLSDDKFCTDSDGSESAVQGGDSGGGLTFNFGGLHYVYGIVSVKLVPPTEEKGKEYVWGCFTDIYKHMDWLQKQLTTIYK